MKTYRYIFLALSCLFAAHAAMAQSEDADTLRRYTHQHFVALGAANILDTYLSPEQYKGMEMRYMFRSWRQLKHPAWQRMLHHEADVRTSGNRADNADMLGLDYRFRIGWLRTWTMLEGKLSLQAGATADAMVGVLYNTRNQNNPAQLRASVSLSPMARAQYDFSISRRPFRATWEVSAPLVGVMFSPNYGQSYYEIFTRGNYDHNIVPTTIGSTPSLQSLLTLQTTWKKTAVMLGYMAEAQQSHVNDLKTHTYNHMIVVGITRKFSITHYRP